MSDLLGQADIIELLNKIILYNYHESIKFFPKTLTDDRKKIKNIFKEKIYYKKIE